MAKIAPPCRKRVAEFEKKLIDQADKLVEIDVTNTRSVPFVQAIDINGKVIDKRRYLNDIVERKKMPKRQFQLHHGIISESMYAARSDHDWWILISSHLINHMWECHESEDQTFKLEDLIFR